MLWCTLQFQQKGNCHISLGAPLPHQKLPQRFATYGNPIALRSEGHGVERLVPQAQRLQSLHVGHFVEHEDTLAEARREDPRVGVEGASGDLLVGLLLAERLGRDGPGAWPTTNGE